MTRYRKKEQLDNYFLTIENDVNSFYSFCRREYNYFNQIAGETLFRKKWENKYLRMSVCFILPIVLPLYDVYAYIRYMYLVIKTPRCHIFSDRLFICMDRLYNVAKGTNLLRQDDMWFYTPSYQAKKPNNYKCIDIENIVSLSDVTRSFFLALVVHIEIIKRYGYRCELLSQKAFVWFLTDLALRKVPQEVNIFFGFQRDRLAILIDRLPHPYKSLVEHGAMHCYHVPEGNPNFIWYDDYQFYALNNHYVINTLSDVYCYSEIDKEAFKKTIIGGRPKFHIIGTSFKPTFKPEGKSVLIIGNSAEYGHIERQIVEQLQDLDIGIYVKNHPVLPDSNYDSMRREYNFTYLEGCAKEMPDVDVVISYESTLAYDYMALGTKVLLYGDFEIKDIKSIINDCLNK